MGRSNIRDFIRMDDVSVAAVCDVWEHNRNRAVEMTGGKARAFSDFRRVLELDEVDAVVISTPDHWHAPIAIAACQAGKDVYVEKPLARTIHEGRKMVEAAREHQRVVQMGTQQRSGKHYQEVVELVRQGKLGKVTRAAAWNYSNESPLGIGNPADSDPPPGLDWDMYLGPAPKVRFNPNRFIYNFRWFWDYSGGTVTDWGTHHVDIVHWALNVHAPLAVSTAGAKYVLQDNRETPDTIEATFEYPGFIYTYSYRVLNGHTNQGRNFGIQFYGTDGTLFVDRKGYELKPETAIIDQQPVPPYLAQLEKPSQPWEETWRMRPARTEYMVGGGSEQHISHVRNFLDCVKSREKPRSDVEIGHYSTTATHLANIAFHTGRKIRWDVETERVIDDSEANELLHYEYRKPWKL